MPDPNARRDKALESIAGSLGDLVELLKKVEKNTRRTSITNHCERPYPFDVPQVQNEPGELAKDEPERVQPSGYDVFVQSQHPYFQRSPQADATDPERGSEIDGTNAVD